jgi:hypothetical protein
MSILNKSKTYLALNNELEIIDANTSMEQKKLIHFKSLRNFIFYYDYFKKEKKSRENLLEEYIKVVKDQNYSFSKEQSQAAFDMYIYPLGKIYSKHINFSSSLNILLIVLYFTIPNILVWEMFHSITFSFSFLPLIFVYWLNYILKYPRKKIYGYRY